MLKTAMQPTLLRIINNIITSCLFVCLFCVQVLFTDYGNTEVVSLSNIRSLVGKFQKDPPFAIQCHLSEVMPGADKWTKTACEFLADTLSDLECVIVKKVMLEETDTKQVRGTDLACHKAMVSVALLTPCTHVIRSNCATFTIFVGNNISCKRSVAQNTHSDIPLQSGASKIILMMMSGELGQ